MQRHRQRAADRPQIARQGQFTGELVLGKCFGSDLIRGSENAQRDRQIEAPALLGQIGGRQIDRDTPLRKFELAGLDGGAHTVARLAHFGIRQANQVEAGQPVGEVHLDHHRWRGHAIEGTGVNNGKTHGRRV